MIFCRSYSMSDLDTFSFCIKMFPQETKKKKSEKITGRKDVDSILLKTAMFISGTLTDLLQTALNTNKRAFHMVV